jgi:GAF domain-containing protein
LKLPTPNLTTAQRQLRSVRFANQIGCGIGIVLGCIIGMFPLLFIDSNKIQAMKRDRQLESLFEDVVNEAKTLVGAESTCLYLRVSADKKGNHIHNDISYKADPNGDYLFAMYYVVPHGGSHVPGITLAKRKSMRKVEVERSRLVPLGRGIVSRPVLTAESWNIEDVKKEPDFSPARHAEIQNMVVVPVMDGNGRPIAVIEAVNKIAVGAAKSDAEPQPENTGFTDLDEQILIALAGHISVSLQTFYHDLDDEEELRFRDTIKILKEHGIAGLEKGVYSAQKPPVENLFPDEE